MLIVNIIIVLLSMAVIGGFLDFLWHTGKLLQASRDRLTIALFLFFLALLFAIPWVIIGTGLGHFDLYGEYTDPMQIWLLIIIIVVLAAMINLRIALFGPREDE